MYEREFLREQGTDSLLVQEQLLSRNRTDILPVQEEALSFQEEDLLLVEEATLCSQEEERLIQGRDVPLMREDDGPIYTLNVRQRCPRKAHLTASTLLLFHVFWHRQTKLRARLC